MQSIAGTFAGQVRKGDRLKIVTVERGECRPDLILWRIAALRPGPDDAVVVFFSGHGAFDDQEDQYFKFPRLGPQTFLTRRQVREAIKAKGTRLGVLITDCCNNISIIPKLPRAPYARGAHGAGAPSFQPSFSVALSGNTRVRRCDILQERGTLSGVPCDENGGRERGPRAGWPVHNIVPGCSCPSPGRIVDLADCGRVDRQPGAQGISAPQTRRTGQRGPTREPTDDPDGLRP